MSQLPLLIEAQIRWYLYEHPLIEFRKKYQNQPHDGPRFKPKMTSGYISFSCHWRDNLNHYNLRGKNALIALGTTWINLSDDVKKNYRESAEETNQKEKALFIRAFPDCEWTKKNSE